MNNIYYLYQITNLINGKIYIGVHKTNNLNDGYMGSGHHLKNAIRCYGIENFRKDILQTFSSEEEMYKAEAEIVNKDFLLREDVYNIALGGNGGDHSNCIDYSKVSQTISHLLLEDPEKWKLAREKSSQFLKEHHPNGWSGKNNPAYGKHWKMPEGHQLGEKNSQYGTHWFTNGEINIKAKECPAGFKLGRVLKKK